METSLFKVTFEDGRVYKVFCENSNQKARYIRSLYTLTDKGYAKHEVLENGIHNIKQWESIIKGNY